MLFVDRITLSSLVRILIFGRSFKAIWYFEKMDPFLRQLLKVICRLGVIRAKVCRIDYNIGQVRNSNGECEFARLLGDARRITARIKRERIIVNPFLNMFEEEWDINKVSLHFEKLVEIYARRECLRIGLVVWMICLQKDFASSKSVLLVRNNLWYSYLRIYAKEQGIQLVAYGIPWDFVKKEKIFSLMISSFNIIPKIALKVIQFRVSKIYKPIQKDFMTNKSSTAEQPINYKIAIRYNYKKLSFDPTERSDLFWLNGTGISYSEIILYDYVSEKPFDPEILSRIKANGICIMGKGHGITAWIPTRHVVPVLVKRISQSLFCLFSCLVYGRWIPLFYIYEMLMLICNYSYWYDFFSANRVLINVGMDNTSSVGKVLALDDLRGVSVVYQYSVSNILDATTALIAGEDVQFVFSDKIKEIRQHLEAPVKTFASIGFIYDGALKMVRGKKRVSEVKQQLYHNGARFIICFYDENSVNEWYIRSSDEDAVEDYKFLLNWLLADPTLGIVFKPKRPYSNLIKRIAGVSELIAQAEKTGRCKFLTSDTLGGSIYPAEAALMADICIGILLGATAALEARLAGVPTVLIDAHGTHSHPFYTWGSGRVVFNDWDLLREAVERYRIAPEMNSEFGDWSPGLNDLDPFQDGHASLRMGLFIRWIREALKQGMPKRSALEAASDKFAQKWGREHLSSNKMKDYHFSELNSIT